MELQPDVSFFGRASDSNPTRARVVDVAQEGREIVLYGDTEHGLRKMSLFGENKNKLIAKWGAVTDKWKGLSFSVLVEAKPDGKKYRTITPS